MAKDTGTRAPAQGATAAEEAVRWAIAALRSGRADEAARLAGDVLKRNPGHPGALHVIGGVHQMQGRPREAIAPLEAAAKALRSAQVDTQLAVALREAGRPDDALARLKRAVKREPPFVGAFRELGFLLFSMRRHDEAVEALRQGIAVAPKAPELLVSLGNMMLARYDHAGAKQAFARALAIHPDNPEALMGLGLGHAADREYAQAATYFQRRLQMVPDDFTTLLNLGHCLLGIGRREEGYACFRAAARGGEKRWGSALNGLLKSEQGRFWLRPSAARAFLEGKG